MNTFELQLGLRNLGADPGVVDGIWGPKTAGAVRVLLLRFNVVRDIPDGRLPVAGEQLIMREIGGLAVGPIDGIVGPATEKARKHWLHGPWRNTMMEGLITDARFPAEVQNRWPKQSEMRQFYGEPGTNLVTITLPYPMRLSWEMQTVVYRTRCHRLVADSLVRILKGTLAAYGEYYVEELRLDVFGGCFALRNMRGGTSLSTHAYGVAVDLDPTRNPLTWGRDRASFARPEYNKFWDEVTKEGWLSLGKARNMDWMHFQAARLG